MKKGAWLKMAFFDNILLAFESLKTNKLRAILTMLGIIIGIGSVIAISTVGSSLSGSINNSMSSVGATNITVSLTQKSSDDTNSNVSVKSFARQTPSESDLITDEMISEYQKAFGDDVKYVELTNSVGDGTVTSQSDLSSTSSVSIIGTNDEYDKAEDINILYGRFTDNEKDASRFVCVVSDYFVENTLSVTPQNAIGQKIYVTINNQVYAFYIQGIYEYESETTSSDTSSDSTETTSVYIPMQTSKKFTGSSNGYESITVVTSDTADTSTFLNTTGDFFASYFTNNDVYTVEATSLESMLSAVTQIISAVSIAIGAIAAISLLVGGIGVMNIMLVSITERTKEIGTRKALGAPPNSIKLQFITESVVICLVGGLIGTVLGIGMGSAISKIIGFSAKPSVVAVLGSVAFSMLVGIVFGYAPANKAAKLDPIEALRYE